METTARYDLVGLGSHSDSVFGPLPQRALPSCGVSVLSLR